MQSIDPCVFRDCTQLRSITLPDGLGYIGGAAFAGCEHLEKIH
ncbi:MAG: leucine-rich repeat protein, partial [Clostridia bacterium]|nr:leucine-rich repeat protein [Clostridia bacterium]